MATKAPMKAENGQKTEHGQTQISDFLAQAVSDLTDLRLQVKQSHWNLTGRGFIGIHKLLDQLAEELDETVDTAAERQRALGFLTHGTARHVAKTSKLAQASPERHSVEEIVSHLVEQYCACSKASQESAKGCEEHEDLATSDLFNDTTRMLDQHRYLLQSNLDQE